MSEQHDQSNLPVPRGGAESYWMALYRRPLPAIQPSVVNADYTLDDYWLALFRRRWLILLVAFVAGGAAWYFSRNLPPVYEASSVFYVPIDMGTGGVHARLPSGVQDHAKAYAQILKQPETWQTIAERHAGKPLGRYGMDIDVVVPREGVIRVYVRDRDPALAASIANEFAVYFNEFQDSLIEQELATSVARIDRELQAANASHAAALAAQQAFMEEHQLASLSIRQSGLEQEKLRLAEQLQNQSVQKAMLDRQIAELNEQLDIEAGAYKAGEMTLEDGAVNGLQERLIQIEVQMAGLAVELRPEHPQMKALQQEYDKAKENLEKEVQRVVNSRSKRAGSLHDTLRQRLTMAYVDRSGADAGTQGLQAGIARIEGQVAAIPTLLAEQERRSWEVQRFDGQRRALEATRLDLLNRSLQQKQTALVIDHADPPTTPAFPKPWLNAVVATICGLVIGILYAFLLEHIDLRRKVRMLRMLEVEEWSRTLTTERINGRAIEPVAAAAHAEL